MVWKRKVEVVWSRRGKRIGKGEVRETSLFGQLNNNQSFVKGESDVF